MRGFLRRRGTEPKPLAADHIHDAWWDGYDTAAEEYMRAYKSRAVDYEITGVSRPLPQSSAARKAVPITTGVIDYFPAALAEVAKVSKAGNDKHNPGQPLHHSRGKSTDHADSVARHLIERGGVDPDTGMRHSAEMAWRALALLQQELEDEGLAPLARGASNDDDERYSDVRPPRAV